jgi:hypothetical protein
MEATVKFARQEVNTDGGNHQICPEGSSTPDEATGTFALSGMRAHVERRPLAGRSTGGSPVRTAPPLSNLARRQAEISSTPADPPLKSAETHGLER